MRKIIILALGSITYVIISAFLISDYNNLQNDITVPIRAEVEQAIETKLGDNVIEKDIGIWYGLSPRFDPAPTICNSADQFVSSVQKDQKGFILSKTKNSRLIFIKTYLSYFKGSLSGIIYEEEYSSPKRFVQNYDSKEITFRKNLSRLVGLLLMYFIVVALLSLLFYEFTTTRSKFVLTKKRPIH